MWKAQYLSAVKINAYFLGVGPSDISFALGGLRSFIAKIPRSSRDGVKRRKPLPIFPTNTCPKVKAKFLSMRPNFAYLPLQAHLSPCSVSRFPRTFICKHGIVSHLYAMTPPPPNHRLLPLSPTLPSILLEAPIHLLRLDSGPRAVFSELSDSKFHFWLHGRLSFLPAHLRIKYRFAVPHPPIPPPTISQALFPQCQA